VTPLLAAAAGSYSQQFSPSMSISLIGWAGSALVIAAYWPQIRHLYVEKCAWGLSLLTWLLWLIASLFLLTHAFMFRDYLFICVQIINIFAIVTTIILAKRANTVCPYHLAKAEGGASGTSRKL
jgi:lipid-A-disaccharide synthase-like uncharacterized protein